MSKVTTGRGSYPEVELDSDVIAFRSPFDLRTIRLRRRRTKGSGSHKPSLAIMFKLALTAQRGWRKLNGHEKIVSLIQGEKFVNGEMQDAA